MNRDTDRWSRESLRVGQETYKQMLDVLCQFLGSHLLPDQVKPAGLLVFAVVRACPEMAIPVPWCRNFRLGWCWVASITCANHFYHLQVVLPVIFKKLLVHQPKSSVLPLHESGVLWQKWMEMVPHGATGAPLLKHHEQMCLFVLKVIVD